MRRALAHLTRLNLFACFASVLALVSCSSDERSNVEVRIVSDLVPFYEVGVATAALHVGAANAGEVSIGAVERELTVGEPLSRGLWLATFDNVEHGTYTVWISLRRANGELLGKRPVTFTLERDASFTVTIEAACAAVECPGGGNAAFFACVAGDCVDPRCTPETPEHCPAGPSTFCESDDACEPTLPCGVARCESGACLQVPGVDECADGEFCSAISGCTPEERPPEAPEDPPGSCGNACSLLERPCSYAYIVCTGEQSACEAVSDRPEGSPCPNGGVCDANGACIEGVRSDGGVSDAGVSDDMNVFVDLGASPDMAEVMDMATFDDADVASDMTVPVDMMDGVDMGRTPCPSGYLGAVETGCFDIDECTYNVCDSRTVCTNAPGTFSCSACPDGFAGTGETGCERENGCDDSPCDPLTVCNSTGVGTFVCSACPVGYLGTGERGCFDIDECVYGVCDALTDCTNTAGGFTCTACPDGYTGNGAIGCDDVDECAIGLCDALTVCTNTRGGFSCGACPPGTVGDGYSGCEDVDECAVDNGGCGNPRYMACTNTFGSFACGPARGPVRLTQDAPIFSVTLPANDASVYPSLSSDGDLIAFESRATNLVDGGTSGVRDIFVRDMTTGETVLASTTAGGVRGNGDSTRPRIAANGTKVVFLSAASNLVAGDTNDVVDVFMKDLTTGVLVRLSTDASGMQGDGASEDPAISADGAYVAFASAASNLVAGDTNGVRDVFIKEVATGVVTRVSTDASGAQANGESRFASLSADGTKVVFLSAGSNLVAGDGNGRQDVFVKTLATGAIVRASTTSTGTEGNGPSGQAFLSADGAVVLFTSYATNLVAGDTNGRNDAFVKTLATGAIQRVSTSSGGTQANHDTNWIHLDDSGTKVLLGSTATNLVAGDTNGAQDVFLRDLSAGTTVRVSTDAFGAQVAGESGVPVISSDGARVAFYSFGAAFTPNDSNDTADVFVKTLSSGAVALASAGIGESGEQANGASELPRASADGTKVVFLSKATNLVAGDTNGAQDVFLLDLETNSIVRVSVAADGAQADGASSEAHISADGTRVVFTSTATNLVAGDTNGVQDVFVKTLATGAITRVSTSAAGVEGNAVSQSGHLSGNGERVVFVSQASNLVAGDTNGTRDVFVRDLSGGTVVLVSTSAGGAQGDGQCDTPTLSADGSLVAFSSSSTTLVPGDTNATFDIFVKTLASGAISRVSTSASGAQANFGAMSPWLSADGSTVAFISSSTTLAAPCDLVAQLHAYVKTLATGAIVCASVDAGGVPANGSSSDPVLSSDGRRVTFTSSASNLVPGDSNVTDDILVRDLVSGAVVLASARADGSLSNRRSRQPFLFADGRRVVFMSLGSNLVAGDTNSFTDIFLVGLE